jgi:hypothetical protein
MEEGYMARTNLGGVRVQHAAWIAVGVVVVGTLAYTYLARGIGTFFVDEWYVARRLVNGDSAGAYLAPLNGHQSTLLIGVYRALLSSFGMHTHLPYFAALALLQASTTLVLFFVIRRHAGDLIAVVAIVLFTFMARGAENSFWALQLAWYGSLATGSLALLLLERERPAQIAATVSICASLAFSGVGLAMLAAAAAYLLAKGRPRRSWFVFLVPAAAYLVWFALYGRFYTRADLAVWVAHRRAIQTLPLFMLYGMSSGLSGILALPPQAGPPLMIVAVAVLTVVWRRRGLAPHVIAAVTGLTTFYALISLTRGFLGTTQAIESRYIGVAGFFWLIILADAARHIGWRHAPSAGIVVGAGVTAVNLVMLIQIASAYTAAAAFREEELSALAHFRRAPGIDQSAHIDVNQTGEISIADYFAIADRFGTPAAPASGEALATMPPAAVDIPALAAFDGDFKLGAARSAAGCVDIPNRAGYHFVDIASSGSVLAMSPSDSEIRVSFWLRSSTFAHRKTFHLSATRPVTIEVPDAGEPILWHLRLESSAALRAMACR